MTKFLTCYANSLDAFVPEHWAMESIALLLENMVAANLVHRDFEMEFAKFGDTVNTRQPAEMTASRKTNADDVTVQDVSATNVPVVLNQHIHVSFLIRDGEETVSFKDLVQTYLEPAAQAMARKVDLIVLGQYAQFLQNSAGTLGGLTNLNAVEYITNLRNVMNKNKAHMVDRNLILNPDAETKFLQNEAFTSAEKVGDEGTALREASLGRKFAFNIYMEQNMASVPADTTTGLGEINNVAGYPIGTTVLTVDGFASGEVEPGDWITINGIPYHVTATDNAIATSITLEYGLRAAVIDNDDIIVYDMAEVNNGAGYPVGHAKAITIDGTFTLSVGQIVTFQTSNVRYVVIATNGTTSMELDRPLEAAIADNDDVHIGPTGGFNLAFHRNALTLAIRPLALPRPEAGALAGMADFAGLTMRTVITYDGTKQGHLVTLDFLLGVKVLDTDLGAVLLS